MRLRKRTLAALLALLTAVVGVIVFYAVFTNTEAGKDRLARFIVEQATKGFGGRASLTIDRVVSVGLQHIVAENVALRDTADVPVVTVARLHATLSFRALFSRAILLRQLDVEGVRVDLRSDGKGPWNIAYIITGDTTPSVKTGPGFGDDVRIDRIRLTDGIITTTAPWAPHPSLRGAARDSAIMLRDSLHDLVRTPTGFLERRRYALQRVVAREAVISSFDDTPASMKFDTVRADIADPPVRILHAQGRISWTGDSLYLELPDVRLPSSTGSAKGQVAWDRPGPVQFDVTVRAKAGLSDLTWIWDVLPEDGNGTAVVRMRTLSDADSAQYEIRELDMVADNSHITGQVTVVTTPLDLALQDVDLRFDPLQATLMRRLSYDAVPQEVRGALYGRLVAREGGSLDNLLIDRLDARFVDGNVRGATSTLVASGRVTIGAEPAARGVRIASARVDLRTIAAILPDLPRTIDGVVDARGYIESADLRQANVRDVALSWVDAVGNRSAVRGDARVAFGTRNPFLDANLVFEPISMPALARIDTMLPLRSTLAGAVRARGSFDSLTWQASLRATDSSRIEMNGTARIGTPEWQVTGQGPIRSFDVRSWMGTPNTPVTALTGTVAVSVRGGRDAQGVGGLREMRGDLELTQVATPTLPGFNLLASMSLDDNRLRIDSATARMGGLLVSASGALARDTNVANVAAIDTITFSFDADSLGAARPDLLRLSRMLVPVDSSVAASLRAFAEDTLDGTVVGSGYLYGALDGFGATFSFGARALRVSNLEVGRLFGSALFTGLPGRPQFETAATATDVDGIGAIRIATAEFRIGDADPERGSIVLNVASLDTSRLAVRGEYRRNGDSLVVALDTFRFNYHGVRWANRGPILYHELPSGQRLDSLVLTSNEGGRLAAAADLPYSGAMRGSLIVDRFPVGELYAFAMATNPFAGLVSGEASLEGTREAPLLEWQLRVDSLGASGVYLPQVTSDGAYADRRLIARAMLADTLGGSLSAEARVPLDLTFRPVAKRLLSDSVDADVVATQLQLGALGMTYTGVDRITGILDGRMALSGTIDRPFARGEMAIDGFTARVAELGIAPADGRVRVRATRDSLILDEFRFRSGGRTDTLGARGALRFAFGEPAMMYLRVTSNNFVFARMRDGTDVVASADLTAVGRASRPEVSGRVFIPSANVVADPFNASTALDLNSPAARALLGSDEVPVAESAAQSFETLGRFVTIGNARIEFGDEVWVRTPEATVRLTGALNILTTNGELAPEGEVNASRGTYQLNLGVVRRSFTIDSGSVRFYGNNAIPATLDISATNVVRASGSSQIPVRVHIGGTLDVPVLTLSSPDPLYSGAPDSEIISLLIFGAPTFTLDGRSRSTVRAVAGVLAPTAGGLVEGTLQRLLPGGFNTVQVQTGNVQDQDNISAYSLIDNLSIAAGKQLSDKTFLRLNTGVCRGAGAAANTGVSLWYGVAVEYLLARRLTAQVGVDPGGSPCSRIGGDVLPRMQFGFDLFREWIF